ncbi:hypothetical protein STAS_32986 [Striga asiatica]|uniref:Uncharacterized protein n=1 Tax=Striga asiatica TaxID=4170 RepID=A0A5A7REQ9_STRAF|nr:hypothetical protein STAS_32986 [Striga asiatica]
MADRFAQNTSKSTNQKEKTISKKANLIWNVDATCSGKALDLVKVEPIIRGSYRLEAHAHALSIFLSLGGHIQAVDPTATAANRALVGHVGHARLQIRDYRPTTDGCLHSGPVSRHYYHHGYREDHG